MMSKNRCPFYHHDNGECDRKVQINLYMGRDEFCSTGCKLDFDHFLYACQDEKKRQEGGEDFSRREKDIYYCRKGLMSCVVGGQTDTNRCKHPGVCTSKVLDHRDPDIPDRREREQPTTGSIRRNGKDAFYHANDRRSSRGRRKGENDD